MDCGAYMNSTESRLSRVLDLPAAVAIGIAAMVGTGVFAVWTPVDTLVRGPVLLIALALAATVAALNAWSTARLAAAIPLAGGVYTYGRQLLNRPMGVLAGYAFWISKTGSSAVAALAIGAYLWPEQQKSVALAAIALALLIDLRGIVRSAQVLAVSAAIVVGILVSFSIVVISDTGGQWVSTPVSHQSSAIDVTAAAALLFIAFAGYARIATLGEEVRNPARTIPRAMTISLLAVVTLYGLVAAAIWAGTTGGTGGTGSMVLSPAALSDIATNSGRTELLIPLKVAVVLAAGGTILSLIAGMGRTVFAMASNGDAPRPLATVEASRSVPRRAEIVVSLGVAGVAIAGGIPFALGVAAVAILLYYSIAHLAVLRLQPASARPPRLVPLFGLIGCAGLGLSLLWVTVGG
jgi:basic amino acid/polyamine antiporter, APA family